jgi:hypothetical protein
MSKEISNIEALDTLKLKSILKLKKSITQLSKTNQFGEFTGELKILNLIKENIKSKIITGEGKLAAAILD